MTATDVDLVVVGAGIVGLATAVAAVDRRPGASVLVLDKEKEVGTHQTGRNSGVIHAGVYYRPGSAKAELCREGREAMVAYCAARGIRHEVCGKVVVATSNEELGRLDELARRCETNGVRVARLGPAGLRDVEPNVTGVAGLHVLDTGIVDYREVARALAADAATAGVEIRLGTEVLTGREEGEGVWLSTTGGTVRARRAVTCGGLHADRIARAISGPGGDAGMRIVPFRGEYHELRPDRAHLVRSLIYPVPDPQFPFLGVHLTRGIDGHVHLGPNAVLALAREGYRWRDVEVRDLLETARFSGFHVLARRHWRYGLQEMARSASRRRFANAVRRLVPAVADRDLVRATSGVRAQAVAADGTLVDDFAFHRSGRALHVLNAPSPAATASLAIGRRIIERLDDAT